MRRHLCRHLPYRWHPRRGQQLLIGRGCADRRRLGRHRGVRRRGTGRAVDPCGRGLPVATAVPVRADGSCHLGTVSRRQDPSAMRRCGQAARWWGSGPAGGIGCGRCSRSGRSRRVNAPLPRRWVLVRRGQRAASWPSPRRPVLLEVRGSQRSRVASRC